MDIFLIILLAIVGIVLLLVELFLLPGFGLAGITSIGCLIGCVYTAYFYRGALAGHITLAVLLVLCAIAVWVFLQRRMLDKMALKTDITSKVDLLHATNIKVGDQGICISRLAPMGKVRIRETEIEAKSQDVFIDDATPIEVIALDGNKVIVRPIK